MYRIEVRLPTVDEYLALRRAVGWKVPAAEEASSALAHSTSGAVAVTTEGVVGSGRLVGDGAFYAFVVDLIVVPEHQGHGVGRRLLTTLEDLAVGSGNATGTLQLVAEDAVTVFYERCGFERSPDRLLRKRLR